MTFRCINFDEESEEFEYTPGYAAGGVPIRGTVHKGGLLICVCLYIYVCMYIINVYMFHAYLCPLQHNFPLFSYSN